MIDASAKAGEGAGVAIGGRGWRPAALRWALPFVVLLGAAQQAASAAPGPVGPERALPEANRLVLEGARDWLRRGFRYDAGYLRIPYPGGDVPADRGACSDLVVRALRHAGIDLQQAIHEDRLARPAAYPARPPDRNLDHRRTEMHVAYLKRHARPLTTGIDAPRLDEWLPGDLVYYGRTRPWHVGIVSDRRAPSGMPYIIDSHPDGGGVSETFLLGHWGPILAHFRLGTADP